MSTDFNVHQMLFKDTFFSIQHMQCPYACCLKSDSEVNNRFSRLFTATDKNIVPDAKMSLNRPSTQYSDVANDDNTDKNLGSNDVSREERHHRNGLSKSKIQDSSIAYSFGKSAYSPIDNLNGKNATIWPDIHNTKDPHGLVYPNPQDAIDKPGNIVPFNHLLNSGVKQGNPFWMLNDFWNKRLSKPQYRSHDESNSLSSGSSSPTIESFGTKLPLNDDSASCPVDSSSDFEYSGGEDHNGGQYWNGGENRNDGEYLTAGDQYRISRQQRYNSVPQSAASMNMLQRNANVGKNEVVYCPICFKKLKHPYHLRRHMIIHSGVKPFQCNFCPRRFSQTGNRNAHMRIHTGEKPFQCDFCNKKFTHASSKRRHAKFCKAL